MLRETIIIFTLLFFINSDCVHDLHSQKTQKHFLNDFTDARLLQTSNKQRIRIFVDYTQVRVGGKTQINLIKRVTNISAIYFYNTLNVTRLPRLYFPKNQSRTCNIFTIPQEYVTNGTIGDIGIVCGNENRDDAVYVAKSTPCAFLQSTKRPIWGMISWNNPFLKYDQQGFQQILFVGIHEMTHILGFSASMYSYFPNDLLVTDPQTKQRYLSSPIINKVITKYFGCQNPKGLLLEDQDGTLIASHWQQKVVGNQFMIASNKKGSYMSEFTLALLQSIGWYDVDYQYVEPSTWGKDKGCDFLDIDNCDFTQFCKDSSFHCDNERTGIGRCSTSPFTGTCKVVKYFTNTVCVDQNYELKNLNSKLNAFERGGSNSRCFKSDYRETGLTPSKLNNRCYVSVCSFTGNFIYILVGSYIMVCSKPGRVIPGPPGLEGDLTCPVNFANQCQNKKTCPYHCNKNGACINGECLCTGKRELSPTCFDVSIFKAPIGDRGGFTTVINGGTGQLIVDENGIVISQKNEDIFTKQVKRYSINSKCIQGTTYDQIFGQCLICSDVFNCEQCDDSGCVICDNNSLPRNRICPMVTKKR